MTDEPSPFILIRAQLFKWALIPFITIYWLTLLPLFLQLFLQIQTPYPGKQIQLPPGRE